MTRIIIAALAALFVTGCTQEQLEANMAKAREVAAAIKRGAAVTASAVRQGLDAVCANQQAVYSAAQVSRAILMQQTGPNSTQNIDNLDKALASYNRVCAAASDPSRTDVASLLAAAIAAYNAVQAARNPVRA